MKSIISAVFIISILFSPLIASASTGDNYVLDIDYNYPEEEFQDLSVTNEASKNVRQDILDEKGIESLDDFPLNHGFIVFETTSPDGNSVMKTDHHLYKNGESIYWVSHLYATPYQAAFSPDSQMIAFLESDQIMDNKYGAVQEYELTIIDPVTDTELVRSGIGIIVEDSSKGTFSRNINEIYWSADGKSIVLDMVMRNRDTEYAYNELSYVKIDIDYENLLDAIPNSENDSFDIEQSTVDTKEITTEVPEEIAEYSSETEDSSEDTEQVQSSPGFSVIIGLLAVSMVLVIKRIK